MHKLLISILAINSLTFSTVLHAETFAVKINDILPELRVQFTDILPDETWRIVGQCPRATRYTSIQVTDLLPDKRVMISDILADHDICITNPREIPDEMWKHIKR
jgi:hypothetical protein